MMFNSAVRVSFNQLDGSQKADQFRLNPDLLFQFPKRCFAQGLSSLDLSAGQGKQAFTRRLAPGGQEHAPVPENCDGGGKERAGRIKAFIGHGETT